MSKYHVHVYPVVRVLVRDVEAESQEEACRKAEEMAELDLLFRSVSFDPPVASVEYSDDLDGFWVDEDGDSEHERSSGYDKEFRPT